MTQAPTLRCDCGRPVAVHATDSPWEFEWRCVCRRAGSISWAHAAPPPAFVAPTPAPATLFEL